MKTIIMHLTIFLLILFTQFTLAFGLLTKNANAYHMHQALNYLGLGSTCASGRPLGLSHLSKIRDAKKEKGNFELLYNELGALSANDYETKETIIALEILRLKFSEYLVKENIEHELNWHKEVKSECPSAPTVP